MLPGSRLFRVNAMSSMLSLLSGTLFLPLVVVYLLVVLVLGLSAVLRPRRGKATGSGVREELPGLPGNRSLVRQ